MTKVKFLIGKDGEVLAYFPFEDYSFPLYGHSMKTCYQHIGQHSSCSPQYVRGLKRADPFKYMPLLKELQSQGYDKLHVL